MIAQGTTVKRNGEARAAEAKANAKARILIVDDHPIVRSGFRSLLNRQSDMICFAEAGNSAEAQKIVAADSLNLAIVDLRLANTDGLELIKVLRALKPQLQCLALSELDQAAYAERALRAGARGFVTKDQNQAELLTAIRSVLAGDVYLPRGLAATLLQSVFAAEADAVRTGVDRLSDRELHILRLIGAGMTSKQIADALHLSRKTVETHRENIKHKLGLPTGTALTHYAINWHRGSVSVPVPTPSTGT